MIEDTTMSGTLEDEQAVVEPGKQEKPVRKRRRVFGEKVCQVCGDKALAHHFGALACETCKAFFRRNALYKNKEEKKCLFRGECPIDVKTRRFCPACRLAKCFTIGMQADLILDDEEKKQRLLKMTEKKCKKEQLHESPEASEKSLGYCQHSPTSTVTTTGGEVAYHADQVSDMLEQAWMTSGAVDPPTFSSPGSLSVDSRWSQEELVADSGHMVMLATSQGLVLGQDTKLLGACGRDSSVIQQSSPECSYPSTPSTPACGVAYLPDTWQPSASTSTSHGAREPPLTPDSLARPSTPLRAPSHFTSSFKHVSREDLPSDPYMYWRLSEEERSLLNQLSAAYQDTVLSVLQGSPPRDNLDNQLVTPELCLQDFELEAANAISFAKRMEDFRQLRLDEQIALLKASTCQVLGIRSCALFVAEKDAWLTEKGYFTVAQCNKLFPNHPHTDASLSFCKTVKSIVKNDVTLYALLHCVVLFDPSDERIIDRQLINAIRDKYIILLRHYLESVYSYVHSEKYMMALQENLITYRSLCHEGKPLIKKFFPSIPNKLLIEVLDLD